MYCQLFSQFAVEPEYKFLNMMRKNQGFSLVEIMVVIAIIGILATMILPNVLGSQEQANKQKVTADLVSLENALALISLR